MKISLSILMSLGFAVIALVGAAVPPPQPPVPLPPVPPAPLVPGVRAPAARIVPPPSFAAVPVPAPGGPTIDALVFDAREKTYDPKAGETHAKFKFFLTNTATTEIIVNNVRTSCGCTAARLPSQPWKIAPGEGGEIGFTVDLAGKVGHITKSGTVLTSAGQQVLLLHVNIPKQTLAAIRTGDRQKNMQIATADRQAVFRNDCATCHVQPLFGQKGKSLYDTACGICHEAEHRQAFVPNLRALNKPTGPQYWQTWITFGREGSLMPAFLKGKGGPLDEEEIASLVEYLETDFKTDKLLPSPITLPAPKPAPFNPLAPKPL